MDENDEKNAAKRDPEQRIAGQPDREGLEAPESSPEQSLTPAPQPPTEDLPPPPEPLAVAKDLPEAPQAPIEELPPVIVEILVTFILVFVVISVATDERASAGVAHLAMGFALACGVLIAGPIIGGSLNPARTLGPMILAGQFTAVWVYIVGPIVGTVLAALAYDHSASQSDATE